MIILALLWVVISFWMMLGETYYEKHWPKKTFPALLWGIGLLLIFARG